MAEAPTTPAADRPLSPHVQIYRWPVTMATSIAHRITGVGNALGALLVAFWLVATAMGSDTHAFAQEIMVSFLGRLILFGFTLSVVYHMLNGVRHLAWDVGKGFALPTARTTGVLVIVLAVVITLGIWVAGYWMGGAYR